MPTSRSTSSIRARAGAGRSIGLADLAEHGAPAVERLVDRLDPGQEVRAVGVVGERATVEPVARAHLDVVEAVEDVELGEGELGEAVQPGGVAEHHAVEPSGPPPPPGDRAELASDVDEPVAVGVGQLGGERPGTDAGRVGLGDPDDAVDVAGAEAGAGARPAGGRVGRGDVGIGAVVEVEERRLGALEQQVLAGGEGLVQQSDGVGDERCEAGAEVGEAGDDVVHVERVTAGGGELAVLGDGSRLDVIGERRQVGHVAGAQPDTAGLVGVGRTDPLQRRADLVVAAHRLGDGVVRLVPREDEVGAAGDLEPGARDPPRLQRVDLVEQRRQVDDDAVADHRHDVVVEHAARDQLQGVTLAADDHGVPGVVPALVADDVAVLLGQQIDDLGLALVSPLRPDDDGDRHVRRLYRLR